MWVYRTLCFVVLVTLAGAAVPVSAVGSLRAEIEAVYRQWDRLMAAKDVNGLAKMLDPSFKGTDPEGNVAGYKTAIRHMSSLMHRCDTLRSRIVVDELHRQGDEVVAWVSMRVTATVRSGKNLETMHFKMRFAETLKKTAKGWKFVASQAFPM